MNQDRLFQITRWRLACWYAGIMSIILGGCSFGVYEAIAYTHRVTIEREIKSVAGTYHDSLELYLKQPGKLEPALNYLFPSLCSVETNCSLVNHRDREAALQERHQLSAIYRGDYYLRLLDTSGRLIAIAGIQPEGLPANVQSESWVDLKDREGIRYLQISLTLETTNDREWGYLLVGRSLQDFHHSIANVGWILLLGFPIALILVAISAWYLGGLAMQPIYHSYQQIQRFTGDAAHELRTPLATIRATIESILLLPVWQENEVKDSLEVIERQNNRMSNLVADLLTLSRIDRGIDNQPSQKCDRVTLNDLINDIAEEFAALALASNIELKIDIRVSKPLQVQGNESQLYRLVADLVINAIQYTSEKGIVTIILETNNRHAIIRIRDTGIGIPTAEQSRIFERFYRVSSDRSRRTGGSGLGLAIALAIAQGHQGSIQVQSELGKGSTFTIRLPKKTE